MLTAFLFMKNLAPSTFKTYLVVVKYKQITRGLSDPNITQMPPLECAIKRAHWLSKSKKHTCLSITPNIILRLKNHWSTSAELRGRDTKMLWGTCCLYFLGFLRSEEVVAAMESSYDPKATLCYRDVCIDSHLKPSFM